MKKYNIRIFEIPYTNVMLEDMTEKEVIDYIETLDECYDYEVYKKTNVTDKFKNKE